jgi:hypothetical protein
MTQLPVSPQTPASIPALVPRGHGHQFILYGDSCSGIPDALHARTFAQVNAIVARITPQPDFIIFSGDEIAGLTADADELRAQWRHWLAVEMHWLDRQAIPLWHATGNHTAYNTMSEAVFREMLPLPLNGPRGQEGLSYWVRHDDLLLVFVHTLWTGLGGEGHVETTWLGSILQQHSDARYKLVVGHHPIFPVNGFSGAYVREVGAEHGREFWDLLVIHNVLAYVCSHILAFDVQVHRGVLQITTAGAGTAHRMPEEIEYLHCVQAALDPAGLRYQVLDTAGRIRERLSWPLEFPSDHCWRMLDAGVNDAPVEGRLEAGSMVALHFTGHAAPRGTSGVQTLLAAFDAGVLAPLWIGLRGRDQQLTLTIGPTPRRSPHYWLGPALRAGEPFDIQLLLHADMGPGGIMCRSGSDAAWSSLESASAWGAERLDWPSQWSVGHGQAGADDAPFKGSDLVVSTSAG